MLLRLENGYKISSGLVFDAEYKLVTDPPQQIADIAARTKSDPVFEELWTCQCHTGDPPGHKTDKHAVKDCDGEPEKVTFLVDKEYLPLSKPAHLLGFYERKLEKDRLGFYHGLDLAPLSDEPVATPAPIVVWQEPLSFDKSLMYCIEQGQGGWTTVINTDGMSARLKAPHKKNMLIPGRFVCGDEIDAPPAGAAQKYVAKRCDEMFNTAAVGHRQAHCRCIYTHDKLKCPVALEWVLVIGEDELYLPKEAYLDAFCAMQLHWKDPQVMIVVHENRLALQHISATLKRPMHSTVYCVWYDGALSWIFAENHISTVEMPLDSGRAYMWQGTTFDECDDAVSDELFGYFCERYYVDPSDDDLGVVASSAKHDEIVLTVLPKSGEKDRVVLTGMACAIWHGFGGELRSIVLDAELDTDRLELAFVHSGIIYVPGG